MPFCFYSAVQEAVAEGYRIIPVPGVCLYLRNDVVSCHLLHRYFRKFISE